MNLNQVTVPIHQVDQLPSGGEVWIYCECENLDDQVAELIKTGIQFEQLTTDQSWLWREARLKDPGGNQLILFHAGANRLHPPWRIGT